MGMEGKGRVPRSVVWACDEFVMETGLGSADNLEEIREEMERLEGEMDLRRFGSEYKERKKGIKGGGGGGGGYVLLDC